MKNKVQLPTARLAMLLVITVGVMIAVTNTGHAQEQQVKIKPSERIVFLGDSITQSGAGPGGYVTLVRQAIEKAQPDAEIEVIGAGISGNRVPNLEARVDKDVLAKQPTTVVIYVGINDVWHSKSGRGTPRDEFEAGLLRLIAKLHAADAKVILCTASVIGEKPDGSNELDEMLDDYCEVSRGVAKATGSQLLDLRKEFLAYLTEHNTENEERGVLTTDGVHLNAKGNQFVAELMLNALSADADAERLLRHIVMFAFKEDAPAGKVDEVVAAFAALPDKIDTIVDFEHGTDVSVENRAQGFTHCFVVTFKDQAGLDAYLPHAAHQEFVQLVGPVMEKVLVFDYWSKD